MPPPPRETPAVRIHAHGGPEQLVHELLPLAAPGPTDVVVEVHAAGVSGWDVKYRHGRVATLQLPGRAFFPLPQQLGREAAGTVVWVGPQVSSLSIGDHVVAATHPEDSFSRAAARGLGNLSPGVALPGHQAPGAYARFLVRDERHWFRLPADVDLEQAAVTLWSFSTAHRIVADRCRVQMADSFLVLGGTGAMGMAVVQLARMRGARVIATCRGQQRREQLRELGADTVVDAVAPEELAGRLREVSGPDGIDHAVDFTGSASMIAAALGVLRPGASLCVTSGEHDPDPLPVRAAEMIRLELNLLGVRGARRNDALVALDLLARKQIRVPVAARFPLEQADQAHVVFESGAAGFGRAQADGVNRARPAGPSRPAGIDRPAPRSRPVRRRRHGRGRKTCCVEQAPGSNRSARHPSEAQ